VNDADTFEYAMPSLGADMDEGRVIEWRVATGDTVHRGDLIAVVETEKSDIDIEIWHDGIIEEFLVEVGQPVDVGTPIARLRSVDGSVPAPPSQGAAPEALRSDAEERIPASPYARRLAAERGVDLRTLRGSGPGGAVIEADVVTAAAISAPPADEIQGQTPDVIGARRRSPDTMRTLIAERMATANREIPHYHLARDLDVGELEGWLADRNAQRPIADRILPAACYIRAVALAAARHRELNGFWVDDHFEPAESVDVAMAISLRRGGLVTPRIERADERTLDDVMAALSQLVTAARSGNLRASWMTGATITITHLGDTGADLVHGVISPPQVALVGFGRTRQRPWVTDGAIVARPIVTTTLAADHRATDGAIGSRFVATLADLIDRPEELL
jgi:pyruvate dehydrogenase E2 component (dihydrolipoamide acetyltransferase)